MKFAIILCFLFGAFGAMVADSEIDDATLKEILEDPELASYLDDPDKLLELLKHKLRSQPKEQQCYISTNKQDTIIKTKESQENGATFISVPTVSGRQECISACCNITSCNTAIIKEKVDEPAACYLFDCQDPNICVFSDHSGFSSIQFYSRQDVDARRTTTTTQRPSSTVARPLRGQLYGKCSADSDCVGGHERIGCKTGICHCKHGYHPVGGVCRQDCGLYEFECLNPNSPKKSQCVAVYFHCDGTRQCDDGSDETNCTSDDVVLVSHLTTLTPNGSVPVPTSRTHSKQNLKSTLAAVTASTDSNHVDKSDDVLVAKPIQPQMSAAAKGAVVALTLGVAIVALLAVFIGCHLRGFRRRSWKGRLQTPADEDYLINGMYL